MNKKKVQFKIFKDGRPLEDDDFEDQLHQHIPSHEPTDASLSLTKFNSTYIEIVDAGFQWVGIGTTFVAILSTLLFSYIDLALFIMSFPLLIIFLFILWIEWFRWTHYPVRLNRKKRMLYKFTVKGKIIAVPWDEVFFKSFTPVTDESLATSQIFGMVLDEKREKVMEAFTIGSQVESREELLGQWEFFRSYMEDGPQAVIHAVDVCMPITNKRETYFQGLKRLLAHFEGIFRWIMFPFCFLVSIGRWIAMRTSRVPRWPKEIEDACAIEPDDPYARDASTNPPRARFGY